MLPRLTTAPRLRLGVVNLGEIIMAHAFLGHIPEVRAEPQAPVET